MSSRRIIITPPIMKTSHHTKPIFGCARWAGRMTRDSTSDSRSTRITTTGICMKNFPITPGMNRSGAKAMQLVRIAKMTGAATSFTPPIAACMPL